MFYLSSLTKEICIYPKDITTDIRFLISSKIREIEGSVIGNHGYIVSIVEFNQTSKGKIDNETGRVNFKIMYKAITFKPFKGELIDTYPIFINEHGFFCKVGPMQIFVSQHMMTNWKYDSEKNIWIKNKQLKNLKSVDSVTDSESDSESGSSSDLEPTYQIIKINQIIRIVIIAIRINSNEITALGQLEENT